MVDNQIKDETTIGGAIEVAHPTDLTDRVQARPFGKMRTGFRIWCMLVSMSNLMRTMKHLQCLAIL